VKHEDTKATKSSPSFVNVSLTHRKTIPLLAAIHFFNGTWRCEYRGSSSQNLGVLRVFVVNWVGG
jgi:hypothetical protein